MAIYNEYITALGISVEYDSASKVVTVIVEQDGKEVEIELGKMTDDGIKLLKRNQTSIALKKACDKLWSLSHLKDADKKKQARKDESRKTVTTELLGMRKAVNDTAKAKKSESAKEVKSETNGRSKDPSIASLN